MTQPTQSAPASGLPRKRGQIKKTGQSGTFWELLASLPALFLGFILARWTLRAFSPILTKLDEEWIALVFAASYLIFAGLVELFIARLRKAFSQRATTVNAPAKRVFPNWIKVVITVVVVPLIVSVAANIITIRGETVLHLLITRNEPPTIVEQIGNAIHSSMEVRTKTAGIEALRALHSKDAEGQLVLVLDREPPCFDDTECHRSLVQALASYYDLGIRDSLIDALTRHIVEAQRGDSGLAQGIHDNYFKAPFDSLRGDITRHSASKDSALSQLEVIEGNLKQQLSSIERSSPNDRTSINAVDMVLESFRNMKIKEDTRVKGLARAIADDGKYAAATRVRAIPLVIKLSTAEELQWVVKFLNDSDESLKVAALEGIAELYHRSTGGNEN